MSVYQSVFLPFGSSAITLRSLRQFTLTVSATNANYVVTPQKEKYTAEDVITITMTASEGYTVDGGTWDKGTANNFISAAGVATLNLNSDTTVSFSAPEIPGEYGQIQQFGITWTFDKPISIDGAAGTYQYGQYVNGDYWVQGPLSIIGISPQSQVAAVRQRVNTKGALMDSYAYDTVINGSMLNPAVSSNQGYDSDTLGYSDDYNINYPNLTPENPLFVDTDTTPIQSIVSAISLDNPFDGDGRPKLRTAAILTVVASVPGATAFRPPYNGAIKPAEITAASIDLETTPIANLTPVALKPWTCPADKSPLEWAETITKRVWLVHNAAWWGFFSMPQDNVNEFTSSYVQYSRDFGQWIAQAVLVLNTNTGQDKTQLMYYIIQHGIDRYGIINELPTMFTNDGGGQSGQWLTFAVAAYLLDHTDMKEMLSRAGQYRYTSVDEDGFKYWPTRTTPDYVHFGELDQTHYVSQTHVDITHDTYTVYVSGSGLSPDIAGFYTRGEDINGNKTYYRSTGNIAGLTGFTRGPVIYKHAELGWIIFWSQAYSGEVDYTWVLGEAETPYGSYTPAGSATGTASVSVPTNDFAASDWRPAGSSPEKYEGPDIGMPEWGIRHATFPALNDRSWSASYRTTAAPPFPVTALVAHIMGITEYANHPAFFDYADRYVSIQGLETSFTAQMWAAYRADYATAWVSGKYWAGKYVTNGASTYKCIVDYTELEPGVDSGWESDWELIT